MRRYSPLFFVALVTTLLIASCGGSETTTNTPASNTAADPEGNVERTLKVLPDSAFKQEISLVNPPTTLAPGARADLTVRVKNTSDTAWPMRGRVGDGFYQVNLGDRWIDAADSDVKVDERVFLPRPLKPGEEAELPFVMIAPGKQGDYTVEFDMVQEGVAWFRNKGATPTKIKIKIQ